MKYLMVVIAMLMSVVAEGAVLVDANGIIVGYTQEQCQGGPCHGYGYGGAIVGTGPQGVAGRDGQDGAQGVAGEKGNQGETGPKGDKGDSAPAKAPGEETYVYGESPRPLIVNVGAEVRWYDAKHFSLNSGYRWDTRNHGQTIDAAIVQIKIGRSYEQRELDKLTREVRHLQRRDSAGILQ